MPFNYLEIAKTIPHLPGVYKYFNENDEIIYIGKAKDLRKRVASYFVKKHEHYKTRMLVSQITKLEFTIVTSEQDAFLLESSLIKHFQPKYNIALKDDKSYPHIVIKNEEFPRIFFTRNIIKDGSTYIGPYTNVFQAKQLLELLKLTLPIRTCNLPLTVASIEKHKWKSCLEYQIGNCKAPCINAQSKEEYNWYVQQIKEILKGKLNEIVKKYKTEMNILATQMQFEKAEIIKKKIDFLQSYASKSVIVSTSINNVDVITIQSTESQAVLNYLSVFNGAIVHSKTVIVEKKLEETDAEILAYTLPIFQQQFGTAAKEIVCEIQFDLLDVQTKITIPKLGDKKKLIELSIQNVTYFINELKREKTLMLEDSSIKNEQVLTEIKTNLRLKDLPVHIECFDNSNFQGSYPVAAMVCFKNGMPSKKDYRRFHIKTVEGINDFASMSEIVYRRYKRLQDENQPLPQLVIIDGGKGQLSAAQKSIVELNLQGKMTLVGLAKNVEELFFVGDTESLKLPYQSQSLNLIKNIRDEVHRFGITFHRNTRSKGVIKNELHTIKGIGEKTAVELLKKYKNINKIKQLTQHEIAGEIGTAKARLVWEWFNKEEIYGKY